VSFRVTFVTSDKTRRAVPLQQQSFLDYDEFQELSEWKTLLSYENGAFGMFKHLFDRSPCYRPLLETTA